MLLATTAVLSVLLAGCEVITMHLLQDKVQDEVQDQSSAVSEDAIVIQGPAVLPSGGGETTYAVDPSPERHIYVIDQDGTNEARSIPAAENEEGASLSPDGEKIAFLSFDVRTRGGNPSGVIDVYVMDPNGTDKTKITTNNPFLDVERTIRGQPAWSPDSERVAFTSYTVEYASPSSSTEPDSEYAEEVNGIYVANASGLGIPSMIRHYPEELDPEAVSNLTWSPDGEKMAFYDGARIEVIKHDKNGQWNHLQFLENAQAPHSWSPDGKRIAFVDELVSDLYLTNADGSGQRRLTNSLVAEGYPAWSPDGKKIAFVGQYDLHLYVINADGSGRKRLAKTMPWKGYSPKMR
jgi:Tol biopolymer transport system component